MKGILIVGILYSDKKILSKAVEKIKHKFGEILKEGETYDFEFTDYYQDEFGKNLKKKLIVFKEEIKRENLAGIKVFTNKLEKEFSKSNKRTVNLDPGYFTLNSLVLASTKERPHRIYLGKGIFAEITFVFKKDSCMTYYHTYPDFKTAKIQQFFLNLRRNIFLKD